MNILRRLSAGSDNDPLYTLGRPITSQQNGHFSFYLDTGSLLNTGGPE